jgi:hypothetical protein
MSHHAMIISLIHDALRDGLQQVSGSNKDLLTFYKRRWDECRSDEHATWGGCVYYFEVAPDGRVMRQMEIYDNGTVLQYHANHIEDAFGFLTDLAIDLLEFSEFYISRGEFETAWSSHPPTDLA